MKRPPGLWILLSAGFLWLTLDDVYAVRATSLIFGKSTTTTTTTTTAQPEASDDESVTTEQSVDANSTKPTLTGVPQLDYVWDPNLPKELNGYNLSDYPFYERVPEDIDFKCDGLHDGFYASVKHKCQVYHHCLFGVRYDFLCANYTAFDQTLFNCNFVSNVDCENSKKFWHRNDELYKTKSTTTVAPVIYNFRTPPSPQIYALTPSPVNQIPADQLAVIQPQLQPVLPVITGDRRRPRPSGRRRPAYDYYDYEERPMRTRPRSRPYYYDYDDYEDDRYERRGSRRRRPYENRPMRRDKDRRRKYEYDDDEYEDDDEEFTLVKKRRGDKRRKYEDDYEDEDKKIRSNRRRPDADSGRKKTKRPIDDDDDDFEYQERKRKPLNDSASRETRKPSRIGARRPPSEEYEDDLQEADDERLEKRRKNNKQSGQIPSITSEGSRTVIKPVSGTLYDRPRLAPKINLPVPKNAAHKYAYKPIGGQTPSSSSSVSKDESEENLTSKPESSSTISKTSADIDEPRSYKKTKLESNSSEGPRINVRKRPIATTEAHQEEPPSGEDELSSAPQEEPVGAKPRTVTRKFRRPFLPSRGGNPYGPRNLKPVGDKAIDSEVLDTEVGQGNPASSEDYEEGEIQERRPDKTKTYRVKSPLLIDVSDDLKKSTSSRDNNDESVLAKQNKAVPQDKPTESSIEKFYENYDETLNEASPVNPLPFRKYPTTGLGSSNSYLLNNRFYRSPLLSISQSK